MGSELPLLIPLVYDPKLSGSIVPELNHATLFDRNGIRLIDSLKRMMDLQRPYYPENLKYHQTMMDTIKASPSCFTITKTEYQGCGTGILHVHFFESMYIVEYKHGQTRWEEVNGLQYQPHTFTTEILYAIKYLQIDLKDCKIDKFNTGIKTYKEHPECFHPRFKLEREEETQALEVERETLAEEKKAFESQTIQLRLERVAFIEKYDQLQLYRKALTEERQELTEYENRLRLERQELDEYVAECKSCLESQKKQIRLEREECQKNLLELESDEIILIKPRLI